MFFIFFYYKFKNIKFFNYWEDFLLYVFNESKVVLLNEYLWSKFLLNFNFNFSLLVFIFCFYRFVIESYIDVWFYLNYVKLKY